jgi:hypothetical protein
MGEIPCSPSPLEAARARTSRKPGAPAGETREGEGQSSAPPFSRRRVLVRVLMPRDIIPTRAAGAENTPEGFSQIMMHEGCQSGAPLRSVLAGRPCCAEHGRDRGLVPDFPLPQTGKPRFLLRRKSSLFDAKSALLRRKNLPVMGKILPVIFPVHFSLPARGESGRRQLPISSVVSEAGRSGLKSERIQRLAVSIFLKKESC